MIRIKAVPGPFVLALSLASGLAGCNSSAGPTMTAASSGYGRAYAAPAQAVSLPPGARCTAEINKWRRQIDQDSKIGLLDTSVYKQIQIEIRPAARACAAGHGREALRLVAASRKRHGYPPG